MNPSVHAPLRPDGTHDVVLVVRVDVVRAGPGFHRTSPYAACPCCGATSVASRVGHFCAWCRKHGHGEQQTKAEG